MYIDICVSNAFDMCEQINWVRYVQQFGFDRPLNRKTYSVSKTKFNVTWVFKQNSLEILFTFDFKNLKHVALFSRSCRKIKTWFRLGPLDFGAGLPIWETTRFYCYPDTMYNQAIYLYTFQGCLFSESIAICNFLERPLEFPHWGIKCAVASVSC